MSGEKRTETRMRCYNTLCIPYISLHPSLHACIVYDCREGRGVIYREYTECYSISFLFLFFFHHSSLYPIKIFAKCFYLLVIYYYYRTYVGVCVTPFFFFFGVRCTQYKVHAQCSFAALAPHMPCMLLVYIACI